MRISGSVFVYGFYPIAVKKHDKRKVENLNHPLRRLLQEHTSTMLMTSSIVVFYEDLAR
jgi:hypothetical protein